MEYKVIKDIPDGFETSVKCGDILYVEKWKGLPTLMHKGKAVCDKDSPYALTRCKPIIKEG